MSLPMSLVAYAPPVGRAACGERVEPHGVVGGGIGDPTASEEALVNVIPGGGGVRCSAKGEPQRDELGPSQSAVRVIEGRPVRISAPGIVLHGRRERRVVRGSVPTTGRSRRRRLQVPRRI